MGAVLHTTWGIIEEADYQGSWMGWLRNERDASAAAAGDGAGTGFALPSLCIPSGGRKRLLQIWNCRVCTYTKCGGLRMHSSHERVMEALCFCAHSKTATATYARCRSFFAPNQGKKYHLLHHEILACSPRACCSTCGAR